MAQTAPPAQELIKKAIQAGQLDQALKLIQQERELSPKDIQMRFMEGVIQAQQGQTDKAIETFRQITASHPDLSEAYNNLGVLYASKGRLEESRTYLEKALQTHPSYAAAHRNLSDVHSQLAKQSYAKALQVDPKVKLQPPQLTLLGSIGNDKRLLASAATTTLPNRPAANNVTADTSAATSTASAKPPSSHSPASAPPAIASASSKPATPVEKTAEVPAPSASNHASAPKVLPNHRATPSAADTKANATASKPGADGGKTDQTNIQTAVLAWAKAWSQKDMNKYLSAYAQNFAPPDKMSRSKWESDRRARIVSKKTISVGIHQMQITVNGDKATVRFQQIYESDNFKGNSSKSLEMVKQGTQWLIVRETVN